MSNISIFSAIKNNNLYEIAKEFILPYEKFCVQLVEKLFQKDEGVQIVVREVGTDFLISGIFYCSLGGTCLPFFLEKDFDVEMAMRNHFSKNNLFCVSGEKSSVDFIVQCVESANKQSVKERREFIFMESNGSSKLIAKDGFTFKKCTKADSDFLFPLQIDYIKEEVVPDGIEINLPSERLTMDRVLKNGRMFAVVDESGKFVCKAQINGESSSYKLIGGVFTSTDYRRKGLAHFMMEYIKNEAESTNRKCVLFVNETNAAAISLYAKSGFKTSGKHSIVYFV